MDNLYHERRRWFLNFKHSFWISRYHPPTTKPMLMGLETFHIWLSFVNVLLSPSDPMSKVTMHSLVKKLAHDTVLVYLGQAGRCSLICNPCGRPWHRQPHEIWTTNRNTNIKAVLFFFFRLRFERMREEKKQQQVLQGAILVLPINVFLAWTWPGGSRGKMKLHMRGAKMSNPWGEKHFSLSIFLKSLSSSVRRGFFPKVLEPLPATLTRENQSRRRDVTLVTTELILFLSSSQSSPGFLY